MLHGTQMRGKWIHCQYPWNIEPNIQMKQCRPCSILELAQAIILHILTLHIYSPSTGFFVDMLLFEEWKVAKKYQVIAIQKIPAIAFLKTEDCLFYRTGDVFQKYGERGEKNLTWHSICKQHSIFSVSYHFLFIYCWMPKAFSTQKIGFRLLFFQLI